MHGTFQKLPPGPFINWLQVSSVRNMLPKETHCSKPKHTLSKYLDTSNWRFGTRHEMLALNSECFEHPQGQVRLSARAHRATTQKKPRFKDLRKAFPFARRRRSDSACAEVRPWLHSPFSQQAKAASDLFARVCLGASLSRLKP